uniref:BPTI/Kunitz inhibitor domain-containing protein n=1 Tax=Astyanax mexicanus TaxID=7994 RepID=A0A8B9GQZ6_ASTMX
HDNYTLDLLSDAVCSLPPEKGNCLALLAQYYYDSEEKICRLFHYSGCHGNGNRFETREACQSMCQGTSPPIIHHPPLILYLNLYSHKREF